MHARVYKDKNSADELHISEPMSNMVERVLAFLKMFIIENFPT